MTNQLAEATPAADGTAVDPRTGRRAGPAQGVVLLVGSCLPVLGSVLLAPLLPTISGAYADTPAVELLVPLALTVPALFIALVSPVAGAVVDRLGRKGVLLVALLAYAVLGTAPLYLDGLGAIVVSRAGVGIAEAFIITGCTTLFGDYFDGRRRARYLGIQSIVTTLSAAVFFAAGGALGESSWRTPFWLYAGSLLVALLVALAIWPTRATTSRAERRAQLPPVPWRRVALPVAASFLGGFVFFTLVVELPFILADLGRSGPSEVGPITATTALAVSAGALAFPWLARRGVAVLLPAALLLAGVGDVVVWFGGSLPAVVAGAVIASVGTGVLLPTLITWSLALLTYEERGRGTGLFTGAIFLGNFVVPFVLLALTAALGALTTAVGVVGLVCLVVAAALGVHLRRSPQPTLVGRH